MKDRGRGGFARRDPVRLDDRRRLAVATALALAVDAFVLAALVGLVEGGSKAAVRGIERSWLRIELAPDLSTAPEAPVSMPPGTGLAEEEPTSRPEEAAPRRDAPKTTAAVGYDPSTSRRDAVALFSESAEPKGPSEATSTETSGAAGVGVTELDAGVLSSREDFLARLDEAIDRKLSYPPRARERGIEGRVVLEIGVDEVGSLTTCAIDTSSGSAMLDVAARRLVIAIFPLPARLASPFNALVAIEYRLR